MTRALNSQTIHFTGHPIAAQMRSNQGKRIQRINFKNVLSFLQFLYVCEILDENDVQVILFSETTYGYLFILQIFFEF